MKKCICLIICLTFLLCGCGEKDSVKENDASVSFSAIDGVSGLPIDNVKIVLPEYEKVLYTNENGRTEKVEVPVMYDMHYSETLAQGYGVLSVLAYKEGYNDYALFLAQVEEQKERNIKIYLFALDAPISKGAPIYTVESPDKEWVNQLLEKYKKYT